MDSIEVRETIVRRLQTDICGPRDENERLPKSRSPKDEYLTGIIYPQESTSDVDETDLMVEEGGGKDLNDPGIDENISVSRTWLPSSFGLSFAICCNNKDTILNLNVKCGKYIYVSDPDDTDNDYWERKQLESNDLIVKISNGKAYYPEDLTNSGIPGLRLHVKCRIIGKSIQFTVSIINNYVDTDDLNFKERIEKCFFQTGLQISVANKDYFDYRDPVATSNEADLKLNAMLYRNTHSYATGHTCSATWNEDQDPPEFINSTWIPIQKVDDVDPSGDPLLIKRLNDISTAGFNAHNFSIIPDEEISNLLSSIPYSYKNWIKVQENASENDLTSDDKKLVQQQAKLANEASQRMERTIHCLLANPEALYAFRYANEAMSIQATWQGYDLVWRPFQLGFVLLTLESLVNRNVARDTMDLLWFPTGGGKTEAYLFLMAFVLFYRRLEQGSLDFDDGVAVLTRYTLRALTTDQFSRTAAMVLACELVRRKHSNSLSTSFSLGLWIGKASTPNTFDEALISINSGIGSTPAVIKICPSCGSEIYWQVDDVREIITASCLSTECKLGKSFGDLPIHTVDDQIYKFRPSIVIGTVDKFAQICRFPNKTNNLFNKGFDCKPPDLIVQDELHLISGPLGTMTGLMELAIDRLCSVDGHKPKIIGSTATIQRASTQVAGLFDRNVFQFPTPVLNADDSFFSRRNTVSTGRYYLGITTAGRTPTYVLQGVSGSLLQAIMMGSIIEHKKAIDPYTTLTIYFNSLRILGGARTLLWEDAQKSKSVYAKTWGEEDRLVKDLQELTSAVSQDELKNTLDRLRHNSESEEHIDMLLASVMLSVGVDIPRLGLMIVDGQPKTMSEYIQATSRVGRNQIPGLIVTIYNNSKTRDRSHFETFKTWHRAFYRHVESTGVTPFASRARDKALKALIVSLATREAGITENDATLTQERKEIIENIIKPLILQRVKNIDKEELQECSKEIDIFLNDWQAKGKLKYLWNDYHPEDSLFISAEQAAKGNATGSVVSTWSAPNSMRDVEPDVEIQVRDNRL